LRREIWPGGGASAASSSGILPKSTRLGLAGQSEGAVNRRLKPAELSRVSEWIRLPLSINGTVAYADFLRDGKPTILQ
jgi:hypothetical protein